MPLLKVRRSIAVHYSVVGAYVLEPYIRGHDLVLLMLDRQISLQLGIERWSYSKLLPHPGVAIAAA